MTIASAIQNAQEKVRNAYTAVSDKGGTVPTEQNLNNLPEAINSISGGGGDIVNTTAMSGAEKLTGGEKVILNPAEGTIVSKMATTGSTFIADSAHHYYYQGGYVDNGEIVGSIPYGTAAQYVLYRGSIKSSEIEFTTTTYTPTLTNTQYFALPPKSKFGYGLYICYYGNKTDYGYMQGGIAKKNEDGSFSLTGASKYNRGGDMNEDGTFFAFTNDSSTYPYFVNKEGTLTSLPIISKGGNYTSSFYFSGSLFFAIVESDSTAVYKIDSTEKHYLVGNVTNVPNGFKALDDNGYLITSDSDNAYILKYSENNSFTKLSSSEQGDSISPFSNVKGCVAVLKKDESKDVADIFIIPKTTPVRIEHYSWDGSKITKLADITTSEDLGSYSVSGDDLHINAEAGLLWGTFFKSSSKTAEGKIFVWSLKDVMITQFKAEPADKAVFDPSKSLTGFVDSNLGIDDVGNTELSVKTALDPNEEPWSDIGRVFGFDVKVTKGE